MSLMQVLVKLGLDAVGYEMGLKQARGMGREFARELSDVVGSKISSIFSFAMMEEGIRRTVEFGSKIQDLSTRTGISTDDLQVFDYAAGKAGTSLESVVKSVEKLGISLNKARVAGPGSEIFQALTRQGIKPEDINSGTLNAAEAFKQVGDQIKDVDTITGQLQDDLKLTMGKTALEVLGIFREDIRKTEEELRKLGIIDPKTIAQLDEFDDSIKRVWVSIRAFMADVFGGIADIFHLGIGYLAGLTAAFQEFFKTGSLKKASDWGTEVFRNTMKQYADAENAAMEKKTKKPYQLEETDDKKKAAAAEKKEIEDVAKIYARIEDEKRRSAMQSMTDAQKLKQLDDDILAAQFRAADAKTEKDYADGQLRIAELERERAAVEKHMKEAEGKGQKGRDLVLRAGSNSLVNIGNFLGVNPDRGVVDKLDVIHLDLRQVVENTKSNGAAGVTFPAS